MTNSNQKVLAKLRRLRLLAEGAGTEGERSAAEAAQRRLVERLEKEGVHVAPELVQEVGASTVPSVDTSDLGFESGFELEDFDLDDEEIMTVIAPAVVDENGSSILVDDAGASTSAGVSIPPGSMHRPTATPFDRVSSSSPTQDIDSPVGQKIPTRKNTIPGEASTHDRRTSSPMLRTEGALKTKENPTPVISSPSPFDTSPSLGDSIGAPPVRRPLSRVDPASSSQVRNLPSRGIPTPPLAESVRASLVKGIPTPPFASDVQAGDDKEAPWRAKTRVKVAFGGAASHREGTMGSAEEAISDAFSSSEGPQKTTAMYVGTIPDEIVSEWTQEPPERNHSRFRSSVHSKPKPKAWHQNWFLTRFGGIITAGVLAWIYFAPVDVDTQKTYVDKSTVPTGMPSIDINESVKRCMHGVNNACVAVGAAIAVETRGAKWVAWEERTACGKGNNSVCDRLGRRFSLEERRRIDATPEERYNMASEDLFSELACALGAASCFKSN